MQVYVFGCGGHARSICDILLGNDPGAQVTFIDEEARDKETILGFPVVKRSKMNQTVEHQFFVAIGDNFQRGRVFDHLPQAKMINIVALTAHVGTNAKIGRGCFIGNNSHVGPEACIGDNVIINNGAIIEHEVEIGDHCHIAPNAIISGRTTVGKHVFLGVGATIIDKITVCSQVLIGAGSVVVEDIVESGVYVGIPARKIKEYENDV